KVFESAINECPVNFLKYSSNGALLYACWRDASITVHNSNNALPIGSYDDIHEGAITSCDLTSDDLKLFSVDRAQLAVLWDCETGIFIFFYLFTYSGKDIRKINENSIMKSSNFFPSDDNLILYSKLKLFDVKVSSNIILDLRSMETVASIAIPNSIQNVCRWAASDIIATGMDNGTVVFHKFKDLIGRTIDQDGPSHFKSIKMHTDKITHINSSFDKTLLLTTSTDRYCKIFNEKDEEPFLIFNFGDQANSASIHPSLKYVI
ncbi:MAG: translation initiation factor eIF3 subunit, partial [Paramarteilia canceri]